MKLKRAENQLKSPLSKAPSLDRPFDRGRGHRIDQPRLTKTQKDRFKDASVHESALSYLPSKYDIPSNDNQTKIMSI